jgi:dienelactone hydrolase
VTYTVDALRTRSGTAYAVLPFHAAPPAPTLLLLAMAGADTLTTEPYCRVGRLLHAQGWNVASLDLPCHGADRRPDERGVPTELADWATRITAGEDIVATFRAQVNDVIDHLVASGAADPSRIAAVGTSRGGFMAFQAGAGDPRIRAIAAFGPVTDLLALREFAGLEANPLVRRLALADAAAALADRAVWITIGHADSRVGTDKAVAFAETLRNAAAARNLPPRITLRIMPVPGHTTAPGMHEEAAVWLASIFPSSPPLIYSRRLPPSSTPPAAAGRGGQRERTKGIDKGNRLGE